MKVTLRASTGAKIRVWRKNDSFHVQLIDGTGQPRICTEIGLFEVIAELAGLDLEEGWQAAEAMRLAEDAERRLPTSDPDDSDGRDGPDGEEPSLRSQNRG